MSQHLGKYREIRRVLVIELFFNIVVAVAKLVIGMSTHTLSMVADGYHSLFDGSSNLVGFVAIYFAYKPADEDHQYGHHKYETVSAILVSFALFAAAYRILAEAYGRLHSDIVPDIGPLNFIVMVATLCVNWGVSTYEMREGKRLKSQLLMSDAAHTRSDVFATSAVILSLIAAKLGLYWLDPIASILIAGIIIGVGYRIVRDGLSVISDAIAVEPERVRKLILELDGVEDVSNIRSRGTEDHVFMDLVCFVQGQMTMSEAHALADRVEQRIQERLPEVRDIVVHLAPIAERHSHGA